MMNKVILIGRTGADPEVRRLENGAAVAKFNLATSETYRDEDGERIQKVEWHKIILWRNIAEMAEKYVKKGMLLSIEGKIENLSYKNADGLEIKYYQIVGSKVVMLDSKN